MAHFAEINDQGAVLRVVSLEDELTQDAKKEVEEVGVSFLHGLLGGTWVQTSYNAAKRGKFAGIGMRYDRVGDVFEHPVRSQP